MISQSIQKLRCTHFRLNTARLASVMSEQTPNPESTLFWIEKGADVLGKGAKSISFESRYACQNSPLASALFKINGVGSVLLSSNSITVTKKKEFEWQVVKPSIELVLSQFVDSGIPFIRPGSVEKTESATPASPEFPADSIEAKIKDLITERVQPFVVQDGGDIEFVSFDEKSGVVKVKMHGACKGCPKSMVTLKMGIERMLKHYVPEVVGVIDVGGDAPPVEDTEKAKEFGP